MDQGLERAERHTSLKGKAEESVLTSRIYAFGVVFVLTKQVQCLLAEYSARNREAQHDRKLGHTSFRTAPQ